MTIRYLECKLSAKVLDALSHGLNAQLHSTLLCLIIYITSF